MSQRLHESIYRQKKSIYVMKDGKKARSNSISEKNMWFRRQSHIFGKII